MRLLQLREKLGTMEGQISHTIVLVMMLVPALCTTHNEEKEHVISEEAGDQVVVLVCRS